MFYNDDDDNYNRCLGLTSISHRLNTLGKAQRLLLLLQHGHHISFSVIYITFPFQSLKLELSSRVIHDEEVVVRCLVQWHLNKMHRC